MSARPRCLFVKSSRRLARRNLVWEQEVASRVVCAIDSSFVRVTKALHLLGTKEVNRLNSCRMHRKAFVSYPGGIGGMRRIPLMHDTSTRLVSLINPDPFSPVLDGSHTYTAGSSQRHLHMIHSTSGLLGWRCKLHEAVVKSICLGHSNPWPGLTICLSDV